MDNTSHDFSDNYVSPRASAFLILVAWLSSWYSLGHPHDHLPHHLGCFTCSICILVAWSNFSLSITFTATFSPVNTCLGHETYEWVQIQNLPIISTLQVWQQHSAPPRWFPPGHKDQQSCFCFHPFSLESGFGPLWYCLFAQWFNVVQCGPFSLLLLPLYIAVYVLSLLGCFIIEMFDIPIWRCFDLSICSLNNHLDLQHFLYYLVKSLFSRSSLQVSCIKGSIIFNWANVWIWRFFLCLWLWLGGSHHSLPVITDQFQLQWKSSLPYRLKILEILYW